jgi:hypothetical protein
MTSPEAPFFSEAEQDRLFSIIEGIDPKMATYYRDEGDGTRSSLVFAHLVWVAQLYVDLLGTEMPPVDPDDPDSFGGPGMTGNHVQNTLGGITDYLTDPCLRTGGEYPVRTPGTYE